jgi:hypothetical protein
MISVRQANESDIVALVPIQLDVHALHTAEFPWRYKQLTSEALKDYIQSHLVNPVSRIFVAHIDN